MTVLDRLRRLDRRLSEVSGATTSRRTDPYYAARFAKRHPFLVALIAGTQAGAWPGVLGVATWICLAVGTGIFLLFLLICAPWGPGSRWFDGLPPPRDT